jgi:hypothetical protein
MLLCFGLKRDYYTVFLLFFSSKNFLQNLNGIRFLRNDDRRVVKCVWNELKIILTQL